MSMAGDKDQISNYADVRTDEHYGGRGGNRMREARGIL